MVTTVSVKSWRELRAKTSTAGELCTGEMGGLTFRGAQEGWQLGLVFGVLLVGKRTRQMEDC